MRVHLRLNVSKEEERLIARWLARYHRGAKRHSIIKACLAAGARAFFQEAGMRQTKATSQGIIIATTPAPVVIPTFTNLGQLVKNQTSPQTTTGAPDNSRPTKLP